MKKSFLTLLLFLLSVVTSGYLRGELLSKIGDEDTETLQSIKGYWIIEDRRSVFQFTGQYACMIDGLKYYVYKRSHLSDRYPLIYTVVKSKKTNRRYFARGRYQDGRFYGSTSRISFSDKNHFTVYYSDNPKKIYYKATRIDMKKKEKKTGHGEE